MIPKILNNMKKIILIVAILVSVNNVCFAEAEKQKQQNQRIDTQKVEIKQSNNCPVACNKNCTKDPKTCTKAQKKNKKTKRTK